MSLRCPPDERALRLVAVEDEAPARSPARVARARAAAVQVALGVAFYQWYSAARHWAAGSEAAAHRNAMRLIDLEASRALQ
jgi:hypothetical protein